MMKIKRKILQRTINNERVFSKSSSKVVALKLPTFHRILSAVRRNILERQTASASPQKVTLPSSTSAISYPRSIISLFSTASKPKWQGAISSTLFINSPNTKFIFTLPSYFLSPYFVNDSRPIRRFLLPKTKYCKADGISPALQHSFFFSLPQLRSNL